MISVKLFHFIENYVLDTEIFHAVITRYIFLGKIVNARKELLIDIRERDEQQGTYKKFIPAVDGRSCSEEKK